MSATIVSAAISYVALEAFIGIAMVIKYVRESGRGPGPERVRRPSLSLIQMKRNSPEQVSGEIRQIRAVLVSHRYAKPIKPKQTIHD